MLNFKDISNEKEKFDSESRQKYKKTIVPLEGFLKIDHFSGFHPHPSTFSQFAFKIVSDDSDVIILHNDFLNQLTGIRFKWMNRIALLFVFFSTGYFWVQYGDPIRQLFFR